MGPRSYRCAQNYHCTRVDNATGTELKEMLKEMCNHLKRNNLYNINICPSVNVQIMTPGLRKCRDINLKNPKVNRILPSPNSPQPFVGYSVYVWYHKGLIFQTVLEFTEEPEEEVVDFPHIQEVHWQAEDIYHCSGGKQLVMWFWYNMHAKW